MKKAIVVFILILFATVSAQAKAIENTEQAINSSGKTRMLAMKNGQVIRGPSLKRLSCRKKRIAQKDIGKAKRTMNETYKALLAYSPIAK